MHLDFTTSSKDSRGQWLLRNLPITAAITTGATETILNGIFKCMEMTPIPHRQFYYFQREHLVSHIENIADSQMRQLRSDLEDANQKVVLQFDAHHASAVCSKHSTAT